VTEVGGVTEFEDLIDGVVRNGNCSGCGACAAISPTVSMELDGAGYLRPIMRHGVGSPPPDAADTFQVVCPGLSVHQPPAGDRSVDPVFGPFVSAWTAWATDADIRRRGSSGGVITALSDWLLAAGAVTEVVGVGAAAASPTRSVPVQIRSRAQALAAAGSRYAPVGTVAGLDVAEPPGAFVGKPCEVDAARRLLARTDPAVESPLLLSFFCAGVPSQDATHELMTELGIAPADATSVTYRGNGCPGDFVVTGADGSTVRASYEESWGHHLGRRIQDRCKVCPDGTGMHADIAVGDFWRTGPDGYPLFDDGAGTSVAIARTARGHDVLMRARDAAVLGLAPVNLDQVAAIQPLQVRRRVELAGRLLGRRLAGDTVPRIRGFGLPRSVLRRPRSTLAALRGAFGRARAKRRTPERGGVR
jgi:coenzyme F420 hydrogenase subunit beta